jgi:AcrR family transcriptional regulator
MSSARIDIAGIRKGQIVEAAIAVIAEKGLPGLSLSEIEHKTGMKRGHLTYYFKTKEDILLAVFDRMMQLMRERAEAEPEFCDSQASFWDRFQHLLEMLVLRPPAHPEFGCLQYTFLSQMSHREDFRQRLAHLYEEWRTHMARDLEIEMARCADAPPIEPRTLASLVQAILHGTIMQLAVDPNAFSREEMVQLCLDAVRKYLEPFAPSKTSSRSPAATAKNGAAKPRRRERAS